MTLNSLPYFSYLASLKFLNYLLLKSLITFANLRFLIMLEIFNYSSKIVSYLSTKSVDNLYEKSVLISLILPWSLAIFHDVYSLVQFWQTFFET